jgi:hypothetical protein
MTDTRKAELLENFRRIENQLSPENLSCDGERPIAEIRRRGAILNRERAAIVTELGYEPTWKELYPE